MIPDLQHRPPATCPHCGLDEYTTRNASDQVTCTNCGYDEGADE